MLYYYHVHNFPEKRISHIIITPTPYTRRFVVELLRFNLCNRKMENVCRLKFRIVYKTYNKIVPIHIRHTTVAHVTFSVLSRFNEAITYSELKHVYSRYIYSNIIR